MSNANGKIWHSAGKFWHSARKSVENEPNTQARRSRIGAESREWLGHEQVERWLGCTDFADIEQIVPHPGDKRGTMSIEVYASPAHYSSWPTRNRLP